MKKIIITLLLILISFLLSLPLRGGEIHELTTNGNIAAVKTLLEKNPGLINSRDDLYRTALHLATFKGHRLLAEMLIEFGADVNAKDKFGFTALDFAAIKKRHVFVELLIGSGANPKDEDEWDILTPRLLPLMRSSEDLADLLVTRGEEIFTKLSQGNSFYNAVLEVKEEQEKKKRPTKHRGAGLIHDAAEKGRLSQIKAILTGNPESVNAKDGRNITPLHYAAVNGHIEVVKYLIAKGAKINSRNNIGITPLYGAVSADRCEAVKLLIAHGANVNDAANEGAVPLHAAVSREIAELLVAHGADVKAFNICGFTPLHMAANLGYTGLADYLIEKEANVDARTIYGWTPLMEAVYGNKISVVRLLIARGADINARSKGGSTPLKVARTLERTGIVELLRSRGAIE